VLYFPEGSYETLEEHTLEAKYQELSQSDKEILLGNLLAPNTPLPTTPPPFKSDMFPEITRKDLAIIFQILGYDHDRVVDEAILGLFSLLWPPTSMTLLKFDYFQLLEEFMQAQLENFHSTRSFRYQSYLVYLILSQNHPYFEAWGMKITDETRSLNPINEWTQR
jgi:hypothetical protein